MCAHDSAVTTSQAISGLQPWLLLFSFNPFYSRLHMRELLGLIYKGNWLDCLYPSMLKTSEVISAKKRSLKIYTPGSESASTRSPMLSGRRFVWAPKM